MLGSERLTNLNADGLGKRSKECQIIKYCHSHDQRASLESTLQNENSHDKILNSSSYSQRSNNKIQYIGLCMSNWKH